MVEHRDINAVEVNDAEGIKRLVALKRNGEIAVVDAKGREMEKYKVPYGSTILVAHVHVGPSTHIMHTIDCRGCEHGDRCFGAGLVGQAQAEARVDLGLVQESAS